MTQLIATVLLLTATAADGKVDDAHATCSSAIAAYKSYRIFQGRAARTMQMSYRVHNSGPIASPEQQMYMREAERIGDLGTAHGKRFQAMTDSFCKEPKKLTCVSKGVSQWQRTVYARLAPLARMGDGPETRDNEARKRQLEASFEDSYGAIEVYCGRGYLNSELLRSCARNLLKPASTIESELRERCTHTLH